MLGYKSPSTSYRHLLTCRIPHLSIVEQRKMAAVLPAPQAWAEPAASGCRMRRDVSMLFQLEQVRDRAWSVRSPPFKADS